MPGMHGRQEGAEGRITRNTKKCLRGHEHVHPLDCDGGFMGVYICQILSAIY